MVVRCHQTIVVEHVGHHSVFLARDSFVCETGYVFWLLFRQVRGDVDEMNGMFDENAAGYVLVPEPMFAGKLFVLG